MKSLFEISFSIVKNKLEYRENLGYTKLNEFVPVDGSRYAMKNLTLIIWITQLGLSVAVPPAVFVLLAVWLRQRGWGSWVIFAGIALGVYGAIEGLRSSLKALERLSADKKKEKPPVSFNEHD